MCENKFAESRWAALPDTADSGYLRIKSGTYNIQVGPDKCVKDTTTHSFILADQTPYRIFLTSLNNTVTFHQAADNRKKPKEGQSAISVFCTMNSGPMKLKLVTKGYSKPIKSDTGVTFHLQFATATNFTNIDPGGYDIYYTTSDNSTSWIKSTEKLDIGFGAVYTLLVGDNKTSQISTTLLTGVSENTVSMGWLVPQYIVVTTGEILFSITGLSLAYSQAPQSMKSIVQAAWLMTTAVGDLIVVIVAEARVIPSQVGEFFFFAALMTVDTIIFMIMGYFYKYQNYSSANPTDGSEFKDTSGLVDNIQTNEDIPLQSNSIQDTHEKRT